MVRRAATTVDDYLAGLSEERRETISTVREVILEHLPEGYREVLNGGMISYEIPLERYPETYNDQPLGYLALASRKNYCALQMQDVYMDPDRRERLERAFERTGKKLDMGKSCLRFRSAEELPLDAIGELIADTPPGAFIETYEASRRR